MKPIEPGCLAILIAGHFDVLRGTVVTVVNRVPEGVRDTRGNLVRDGWIITSDLVELVLHQSGAKSMVASERALQRIDDGDLDLTQEALDDPWKQVTTHKQGVWAPQKQR